LLVASADEYRTLRLTPLGRDVMAGRRSDVSLVLPVARAAKTRARRSKGAAGAAARAAGAVAAAPSSDADPAIVDALRAWRLDEARRRGIAPFIILHDRTLQEIASARPQTTDALLDVAGIGPAKAAEYGDAIVSVVAAHALR
jgi:superfamily II DNA helicase RecQ